MSRRWGPSRDFGSRAWQPKFTKGEQGWWAANESSPIDEGRQKVASPGRSLHPRHPPSRQASASSPYLTPPRRDASRTSDSSSTYRQIIWVLDGGALQRRIATRSKAGPSFHLIGNPPRIFGYPCVYSWLTPLSTISPTEDAHEFWLPDR